MNTINKLTDTLTRLIAETVELDSDKQCLAVELDYLVKHLQRYKQTCEDAKHREEFPDHRMCECDCCIDCGCCECKKHPADCPCADCEKANPLCQDCRKRPKYNDGICEKCYDILQASICDTESEEEESDNEDKKSVGARNGIGTFKTVLNKMGILLCRHCEEEPAVRHESLCEGCFLSDVASDVEEENGDWDGDLDDTPNCHQCGEDCGRSIIAHQKYKMTYFCSEECNRLYDDTEDENACSNV
jgi:hypothetical protein